MKILSESFRRRIETEERRKILQELQEREAIYYSFLSTPKLLTKKYQLWFEKGGAIIFAMIIATIAVVANYLIFVRLLHLEF